MKQDKKTFFKLILIAVMACILFQKIDLGAVMACLKHADRGMLCLAFLLSCFHCLILARKWKVLLGRMDFIRLLGGVLAAHVVTYSIGGQLAGEGGKILYLKKTGENMGKITASVLVDKLTGLFALFLLGFAGMFFSKASLPYEYRLAYGVAVGGCCCIVLGCFHKKTLNMFELLTNKIQKGKGIWKRLGNLLGDMLHAAARFADDKKVIAFNIMWGIVQQAVSAYISYMICCAMEIEVGFGEICWILSLTSVISLIPLSVMGLGASQVSMITLMSFVGVAGESATGYSLMLYIMQLGVAALSIVVLMFFGFKDG